MKSTTRHAICFRVRESVLLLVVASLVRCGEAPTEPPLQTPEPTPTPVVALDLNGEWIWIRNNNSSGIRIQVQHAGSRVTFAWGPSFGGGLEFEGTLSRGLLTGRVVLDGYWRYDVSGRPTPTRISLTGDGYTLELTRE